MRSVAAFALCVATGAVRSDDARSWALAQSGKGWQASNRVQRSVAKLQVKRCALWQRLHSASLLERSDLTMRGHGPWPRAARAGRQVTGFNEASPSFR